MDNSKCIFCKIIAKDLPATFIKENNDVVVIKDIAPKAPIHYLIIPRMHIADLRDLQNTNLASMLLLISQELAQEINEPKNDFKLVVNNGQSVGQRVFHLHLHFLAGKMMSDF